MQPPNSQCCCRFHQRISAPIFRMTARRFFKKSGKIMLYLFAGILLLLVIAWIFINTDFGKRKVRDQVQSYLTKKLHTKIVIGEIDYSLPKWIELKNVYIEDQKKDTLLFGEKLAVDINMLKLIQGNTFIRKVEFKNMYANVYRDSTDSVFNFNFIIDAFSGNKTSEPVITDTAEMKLTLKRLLVENVRLKYADRYAGSEMNAYIKSLDATLTRFQPDRLQFDIENIISGGLDFSMVTYKEAPATTTPTTKNIADTTKPKYELKVTGNLIDLRNLNVVIDNRVNGMYYSNKIQHLAGDKINFDMGALSAKAGKLLLDSSAIKFTSPKPSVADIVVDTLYNTVAVPGWKINVAQLSLSNNQFVFDNNAIAPQPGLDFAHLDMQAIKIKGDNIYYSTDTISGSIGNIAFKDKSGFTLDTTHANLLYTSRGITAEDLYVKTPRSLVKHKLAIRYNSLQQLTTIPESSTVDVELDSSTIAISDLYMLVPSTKQFLDPNRFSNDLVRLGTNITGSLQTMNIPFLQLAGFNGTVINARAILYNVADPKKLGYDITIFNSSIPRSDLAKFLPGNKELAKLPPLINISTNIKGNLTNTTGAVNISSRSFRLNANGTVSNINNPKAIKYNVFIKDGSVDRDFLYTVLPPNTIPPNIELPKLITVRGCARGDANNINPNLTLGGSYGTVAVNGYVRNFSNQQSATYDLDFSTNNFALGKLMKQDSMIGNLTLKGKAKGRGFDVKTMRTDISADVQSAGFNKYNYQNISLTANLDNGRIASEGNVNDSNLQMKYTVSADIKGEYPANLDALLEVDTVQLYKLNLFKDTLNASFKMTVKAPSTSPDNLDIYAYIDTSKVTVSDKSYVLDSIVARANTANGVNDISFRSPFADLNANGAFKYDQLATSVSEYIDKYYNIAKTTTPVTSPQQITFNGEVKKHPLITDLVPGLQYENIPFRGSYASDGGDSALNLNMTIPYIAYNKDVISNGKIEITTINDRISGNINFDTLRYAGNMFYATNITASAANDSLGIALITKDERAVDRFGIGADIKIDGDTYAFSLRQNLLLNYKTWSVAPANRIQYSPEGILVNNFSISSDSASISANSQGAVNSPVDVSIKRFNIRDITSILGRDTLLASGIIDGQFAISDFQKELPSFNGNLTVSGLEYQQQPIGDLALFAEKKDDNAVTANIKLTGNGNELTAKGNYYLNNKENQFDADLDIKKLRLATLQAFSGGAIVNSSGTINGALVANGKFTDPRWKGEIGFDTAKFTVAQLGTPYYIDKQKLSLDYPNISLNRFTIKDSLGHSLVLNGSIRTITLSEYDLDVAVQADDFTLVNTPKAPNSQFYGYAAIDANLVIKGNSSSPDIQGELSLNDKTDLTIVLPESNINKDAAKSVVRFIDRDTFALPEQITFKPAAEVRPSFGQFLNYNLNIEVTKNAALTIVIDPSTGDALKVQGDAQLNAGVNPAGDIILSGNYELNKGYYDLHYQFINRRFDLLPGSTIVFGGEPADARIDITAMYTANASARDLIGNEVGEVDTKLANSFSQKVPFQVLLKLKGSIKKPEISFDIQLPEDNTQLSSQLRTTIENKLQQLRADESATNKQVFSLLLLNRFVGEQSSDFFKSNTSFDQLARESVSKFLSSALDQVAGDLIKGVDVDLNLNSYEDYSTGDAQQKTDLNVAVSKSFLNDRLSITVGKNFGIEGSDAGAKASQKPSNIPDVTINYKLTKDGKYALKAYKKNQFEVIMDGYVVETGVAFTLTMDYDKFRELFQRKRK